MFRPAEVSLARALKDLVDRALLACLDTIIQVFKVPAQPAAQGPAHTGLARAHEADQKDGAYFGCTCQSFCLRLPARPGLHVLIAHRSGRLTHRLAYFSSFLEVDFTTEGKQLDRRCGLVHGSCVGTPRPYGAWRVVKCIGSIKGVTCTYAAQVSRTSTVPAAPATGTSPRSFTACRGRIV